MNMLYKIFKDNKILLSLVQSDFKNRYLGNHLGIVWAFIQPLVMVMVYWFVFVHGFRNTPVDDVPFLMWLLCGMVPWFLINDAVISSSNAIISQSFLVKKIVFEVKLLPIVKVGSSTLANLPFFGLMFVVCICYKYYPSFNWLAIIYYFMCIIVLSLAIGILTCAIMPFFQDIGQIIGIIMQIMFWATPIFWNKTLLTGKLVLIYKLNPFAYIINGFRDTLIYDLPILTHYWQTLYFWVFALSLLFIGNKVFNSLRPHFADVL